MTERKEVPPEVLVELELTRLAMEKPEGPQEPIGQQVEVVAPLPAWDWCGGWADGVFTHMPGARLYLSYQIGGRIYFEGGKRGGILGWFRAGDMEKVRRLPEGQEKA